MSSTAAADLAVAKESTVVIATADHSDTEHEHQQNNNMERKRSYNSLEQEDPATTAASEDLKHASISDKDPLDLSPPSTKKSPESAVVKETTSTPNRVTPEPKGGNDEEMKDRITSPKKKRVREAEEEVREAGEETFDGEGHSSNGTMNSGRTGRSAPEKKRHRDSSEDTSLAVGVPHKVEEVTPLNTTEDVASSDKPSTATPKVAVQPVFGSSVNKNIENSSSAFQNSGFGALATSSTSGFGSLGASKPSVFGGSTSTATGFGGFAGSKSTSDSTDNSAVEGSVASASTGGFGSGFGSTKSGFGGLGVAASTSGFGTGFGGGFGAGFTSAPGQKLSSFAASKPDVVEAEKPTKAFGAPESDADDSSDEDGSDAGLASDDEERNEPDEKKKPKTSKIHINDGEEEEATLVQFRAKLFALESKEAGWKERGVGTLKLNVHKTCVSYDEYTGLPINGSFDTSLRYDDDGEHVAAARLIMRQENTHRVILNTIIVKALKFEEKSAASAVQVLFTAFSEGKPINMLLRMSAPNAKIFMSEIATIQRELP